MIKPYISSRHLSEHNRTMSNEYMARKLQTAKPKINMKCPESFEFYHNQFHRTSARNNRCKNKIFKNI